MEDESLVQHFHGCLAFTSECPNKRGCANDGKLLLMRGKISDFLEIANCSLIIFPIGGSSSLPRLLLQVLLFCIYERVFKQTPDSFSLMRGKISHFSERTEVNHGYVNYMSSATSIVFL